MVAATIAANVLNPAADAAVFDSSNFNFGSSTIVAEKVVREGIYGDFEVDVVPQTRDNAESTFKTAKQTKSKKGKIIVSCSCVIDQNHLLSILILF